MIDSASWRAGLPELPRPVLMGVVNVTPDSFSDGGEWFERDAAIGHGRRPGGSFTRSSVFASVSATAPV